VNFLDGFRFVRKREMLMKYHLWLVVLLMALPPVQAQERNREQPPEIAVPEVQSGEVVEPEVTIIEQDGKTVHQYSVNGHVYMVKIEPAGDFPPYYLLDLDGDGTMDVRRNGPDDIAVPQWVLFRW
jgi:hypothetical protein